MAGMLTVAAYICDRYEKDFGEKIDEMKLQKLMYFAQRESLIRSGKPLFRGTGSSLDQHNYGDFGSNVYIIEPVES